MGGKSKSSQSQTQTTQSADGLVSGDVFNLSSGGAITFSPVDQFPEGVQEIASQLLDLVGSTFKGAREFADQAIEKVATRTQEATQPDLTLQKYLPYVLFTIGAIAVVAVWRK